MTAAPAPITLADADRIRPDVDADIATVAAARAADERLTESQLAHRCQWIAESFRGIDAETAADVGQDLAAYVGKRFGWTPRRSEVAGEWLKRWAVAILRKYTDAALVSMDADAAADADADADADAGTHGVLAEAERRAGIDHVAPAADPDAGELAQALECSAAEADAITAALSGWGSALTAAQAWECSAPAARKRLQRGRDALRARFPHAGELAAAVADAAVIVADPANPQRADVAPAARAAQRAIEHVSGWHAEHPQHAAPLPDAWRGLDIPCPVIDHAQHVPAPVQRNPQRGTAALPDMRQHNGTPTPTYAGTAYVRSTPTPTPHADAATVLRYVARLERVRDALPAMRKPTPHGTPTTDADRMRTWGQLMPVAWYAWTVDAD
jgi:hypothetical protein